MRYGFEWTPGLVLVGAVLILPLAPPFALIALAILALVAAAAVVALAGAVLASPYFLVRHLRRHLAESRQSTEGSAPLAGVIAQATMATTASGSQG
jgi:NADH:ubiquinone oxidoreductase subunit 6 (subunit J)